MTISLRTGFTAAALAAWMLFLPAAFGQGAKPAAAPTTLSFNWEGAYGRANILVWPFRPGGRYEQLVTQHTNGGVKLDIKDKLFGLMDSAFAIGDGRVLMGTQSIPAASGTYPLLDFGGIPGLFSEMPNGATEYANALLDPNMMTAMDEYTRRAGFKVLGAAISLANNSLWGNKPIRTLADFKGVKSRASGRTQTSALRDLGGSPLTLSMAEIEQALSRGTVDAITTSKSFGAERGLTQIAKYVSIWPITPIFPQVIAINVKAGRSYARAAAGPDARFRPAHARNGARPGADGPGLHVVDPLHQDRDGDSRKRRIEKGDGADAAGGEGMARDRRTAGQAGAAHRREPRERPVVRADRGDGGEVSGACKPSAVRCTGSRMQRAIWARSCSWASSCSRWPRWSRATC